MSEEFKHKGFTFCLDIERDEHMGAPWDEHDGHGPVSDWTTRNKRPGEMVLAEDRNSKRFYDFQAAIKIAKKDGWDAEPYKTGTRGEQAVRAVMKDFEYLKDWCDDKWYWCWINVSLRDKNGDVLHGNLEESLGGLQSDDDEYILEAAHDLADGLLARVKSVYIDGNF